MKLEEKRQAILDAIPENYSHKLHLGINLGTAFGLMVFSLFEMGTSYLWLVPIFYFSFLAFEWLVHKFFLHRTIVKRFYDFHINHHILYTHDNMGIKSWKELSWILIPKDIYLWFSAGICLIGFGIQHFNASLAFTMLFSSFSFYIFYEVCHLGWHLYSANKFAKYHKTHHNPSNMRNWNFNVTLPVIDWIVRSLKR